ncbi:MAG: Uma2 family endonuclease [Acidobacteria bacterium]|nr:Uma2 family endonuclease [Acidobacteriota bacterium]
MSSQPVTDITPEEYLERERAAETKHEYVGGDIVAMAGGSLQHSLITANIIGTLRSLLAGRPCVVFSPDARVCVRWNDLITYPDVTVLCGPPQYTDDHRDTLVNPTFLVEVLSPSTKNFDRGEKSRLYRMLPSLNEYLLVDQAPVEIEHWRRLPNGNWELATIRDRDAVLRLSSLDCELPAGEIYRNLELLSE